MSKHDPRFDEQKQLIKTFKSLVSKDGVVADNAVNKHDLIIEANKKPLSILIIGKPRSGKTRVSQDLSKSLDLVHV
jgi:stage III sporulation protein SpoIIIAA